MSQKINMKVNGHKIHAIMQSLFKEYADMELRRKDLNFSLDIISVNQIKKYILHMEYLILTQNQKIS